MASAPRADSAGSVRAIVMATPDGIIRHWDAGIRAIPARFVFLQGPRGEVVGAAALYSQPAGTEVPFGPIVPL